MREQRVKINEAIRTPEVRVISDDLGNLGVMSLRDAVAKARELGLDLIEISPDAKPPVAKIADYGKFLYSQKKKLKEIKAKAHSAASEVKNVQIKVGTSDNDIAIKAKKISDWLSEGHRVKVELYLSGRTKYMERSFLEERLKRILAVIPTAFRVVDDIAQSPKGLITTIEKQK